MNANEFAASRRTVKTAYGEIAYVERGAGPAAVFVHGLLLNGYLWRDVIDLLSPGRRCIAIDIMAHGHTRIAPTEPVSFADQAAMIAAVVDALGLEQIDLVANDSGGGIAQIFAAEHAHRLRTLTLTNCDTHDNYPPPALARFLEIVASGQLAATGKLLLESPDAARQAFGVGYEHPDRVSDETFRVYLAPLFASEESTRNLERFVEAVDHAQTVRIEPKLRRLEVPTLIMWGTADVFFDVKWAYWLQETIPGAREVIEVPGAKLFFPEERPEFFSERVRAFWSAPDSARTARAPSKARRS